MHDIRTPLMVLPMEKGWTDWTRGEVHITDQFPRPSEQNRHVSNQKLCTIHSQLYSGHLRVYWLIIMISQSLDIAQPGSILNFKSWNDVLTWSRTLMTMELFPLLPSIWSILLETILSSKLWSWPGANSGLGEGSILTADITTPTTFQSVQPPLTREGWGRITIT